MRHFAPPLQGWPAACKGGCCAENDCYSMTSWQTAFIALWSHVQPAKRPPEASACRLVFCSMACKSARSDLNYVSLCIATSPVDPCLSFVHDRVLLCVLLTVVVLNAERRMVMFQL